LSDISFGFVGGGLNYLKAKERVLGERRHSFAFSRKSSRKVFNTRPKDISIKIY
jgi:hypothetical protein